MEKENTVVQMELITQRAHCQRQLCEQQPDRQPDPQHALFQSLAQQPQNQSTFPLPHQLALTEASHQTAVLTEDVDSIVVSTELQIQTVSIRAREKFYI